jgi:DNA polymerase I
MLTIPDTLAGEKIWFHYVQSTQDAIRVWKWLNKLPTRILALDTESTGLNPYRVGWQLRTFQFGNDKRSFVVPAKAKSFIERVLCIPDMFWIGHNGPHDIRSIDAHLGYETGVVCQGETYLPCHHDDPRPQREGGIGHGLKEQGMALISSDAGRWEIELKRAFKTIEIPIPGEVYKSGPRKGLQKVRKAKFSEGWSLIDPTHRAYIAYAGSDPILTYRVWGLRKNVVSQFNDLYEFDWLVQQACDRLTRRGMPLDVPYVKRLQHAYNKKIKQFEAIASYLGCENIYSGQQIQAAIEHLGGRIDKFTPTGKAQTTDNVLTDLQGKFSDEIDQLVDAILTAKRLTKRRDAYVHNFLLERDKDNRIHPSINSLAARTARMSVSSPALQQLPTKENEVPVSD